MGRICQQQRWVDACLIEMGGELAVAGDDNKKNGVYSPLAPGWSSLVNGPRKSKHGIGLTSMFFVLNFLIAN